MTYNDTDTLPDRLTEPYREAPHHDVTIDLLTQIRDSLSDIATELRKFSDVSESLAQFANGPMASSPFMKMLGIGR